MQIDLLLDLIKIGCVLMKMGHVAPELRFASDELLLVKYYYNRSNKDEQTKLTRLPTNHAGVRYNTPI